MAVNSSSSTSLLRPLTCYSNTTFYPHVFSCLENTVAITMLTACTVTNTLLLPLYILILWVGFRQWRRQRSITAGTTSHSDVFTYYMVFIEIICVMGWLSYFVAVYTCSLEMMMVGYYSLAISYPGQSFFHCLTCMEHYLAVVHPITYRGLRKARGVKVRNIGIGCVLLLSVGLTGLTALYFPDFPTALWFTSLFLSLVVISFCSLSALWVRIRLGLGKVGGAKERIDPAKQRAVFTIMTILGTLIFRLCGLLLSYLMFNGKTEIGGNQCLVLFSAFWLCLPSSLVLPLLFLHRARKLVSCSHN